MVRTRRCALARASALELCCLLGPGGIRYGWRVTRYHCYERRKMGKGVAFRGGHVLSKLSLLAGFLTFSILVEVCLACYNSLLWTFSALVYLVDCLYQNWMLLPGLRLCIHGIRCPLFSLLSFLIGFIGCVVLIASALGCLYRCRFTQGSGHL